MTKIDCPWTTWLWRCEVEGKNNSWWPDYLGPGDPKPTKGTLYLCVGLFGLSANLLALSSLHKCNVTFSTLVLMQLQCTMNLFGLVAKTICGPIALFTGDPFPLVQWGRIMFQIPGGMLVLAIYGQFALQAMMAINRLIAICFRAKAKIWFSNNRTIIYVSLCIFHGAWNWIMCMFPCCPCYFDHLRHKWGYHRGWGAVARKPLTIASDIVCCSIMMVCYSITYKKIRELGKMKSTEMSSSELKRERKVFFQFLTVALTWFGYSICYRPVYYIDAINKLPVTLMISELIRFWMFTVDPVIYFIFMKALRAHVLYKFSCGRIVIAGLNENEFSTTKKMSTVAMSRKRTLGGSVAPAPNEIIENMRKASAAVLQQQLQEKLQVVQEEQEMEEKKEELPSAIQVKPQDEETEVAEEPEKLQQPVIIVQHS